MPTTGCYKGCITKPVLDIVTQYSWLLMAVLGRVQRCHIWATPPRRNLQTRLHAQLHCKQLDKERHWADDTLWHPKLPLKFQ